MNQTKAPIIKCPHCGSNEGYYTKQRLKGIIGYPEVVYSEAAVAELKAENARLTTKVEALERALKLYTECSVCLFENDRKAKCCDSRNCKWQFDEARFAGK